MKKQAAHRRAINAFLTLGASLTLGLLSFGGLYAILPVLPLGIAAFWLSTIYEGEIYSSNIRDALKKLLDKNHYKISMAETLIAKIEKECQSQGKQLPSFFTDYFAQRDHCIKLKHIHNKNEEQKKKALMANKRLALMQQFFMQTLFHGQVNDLPYANSLHQFLQELELKDGTNKESLIKETTDKKRWIRRGFYFSLASGALFGLGTMYLLLESIAHLTFITISVSALPYIILPLATLSGISYVFLIYNSLSDMIWNETLNNWFKELKHDIKKSSLAKASLLVMATGLLLTLGVVLTICTAGTWWTIGKQSTRGLPFLQKIPKLVTNVLLPFFTGLAALIFTLENTKDSMDLVRHDIFNDCESIEEGQSCFKESQVSIWSKAWQFFIVSLSLLLSPITYMVGEVYEQYKDENNLLQVFNPFRFALTLIEAPIQFIGFILHILSIGVTTDRIPGVSPIFSTLFSATSEGFEDLHYFFLSKKKRDEHCNHSHDLPSQIYKVALSPLYALSALWRWPASYFSEKPLTFKQAFALQFGWHQEAESTTNKIDLPKLSDKWQQQSILMQLKEQQSVYQKDSPAANKHQAYESLIKQTRETPSMSREAFQAMLAQKQKQSSIAEVLATHRSALWCPSKTTSATLMDEINEELASCSL